MTELLTMWRQVADGFSERVEAVGTQDWSKPTCCEQWNVAKLVEHAIGAQRMVPKALGATGAIDASGDDLVVVWRTVREGADAALRAPGAFDQQVKLPFGEMTAGNGLAFPLSDLLVHTWDVSRAIGADDRLNSEACEKAMADLEPIDALLRSPGFYGPKLEPAADADVQDRLLAFLGRPV
jgi:uncharacterized protein (TIGR03086 family)